MTLSFAGLFHGSGDVDLKTAPFLKGTSFHKPSPPPPPMSKRNQILLVGALSPVNHKG